MPEHRAARVIGRLIGGQVIATLALILAVFLIGAKAASDIRASESNARRDEAVRVATARGVQTEAARAACAREVARDFEARGTNRDLAGFARDAARARRAEGRVRLAASYEGRARAAEARIRRIDVRLPEREDDATIAAYCRVRYVDLKP